MFPANLDPAPDAQQAVQHRDIGAATSGRGHKAARRQHRAHQGAGPTVRPRGQRRLEQQLGNDRDIIGDCADQHRQLAIRPGRNFEAESSSRASRRR